MDKRESHIRVPAAAGVGRALLAAVLVIMVLYAGITLFGTETTRAGGYDEDVFIDEVLAESAYPGGDTAWRAYLQRSIVYPAEAVAKDIEGTVVVEFTIDKDGRLREVEAVSGPVSAGLREEAVRVIRGSGAWMPARENGHPVRSYRRQPVVFRLVD